LDEKKFNFERIKILISKETEPPEKRFKFGRN
jgi:hypothetical protein